MFNEKIEKAFNDHFNAELYSAYLYLSMASYFESEDLPGLAHWMYVQYEEERLHAMKFYNYINERGGRVKMQAIEAPPTEWSGVVNVFEETLKHEQHVTSLINNLVTLAMENQDYASHNFLQWFVSEQVEEESGVSAILGQLRRVASNDQGLFMMDRELGARAMTAQASDEKLNPQG